MTVTDATTVPDVDLTRDVPCSDEGCDRAATWAAATACCQLTETFCDRHRAEVIEGLMARNGFLCMCGTSHWPPTRWLTWWPL